MTIFKIQYRSACRILKPANLKKLREIKMTSESRPRKSKNNVNLF